MVEFNMESIKEAIHPDAMMERIPLDDANDDLEAPLLEVKKGGQSQPPQPQSLSLLRQRSTTPSPSRSSSFGSTSEYGFLPTSTPCDECLKGGGGGDASSSSDTDDEYYFRGGDNNNHNNNNEGSISSKRGWLLLSPPMEVPLALLILFGIPMIHWQSIHPIIPVTGGILSYLYQIQITWTGINHMSVWPLLIAGVSRGLCVARYCHHNNINRNSLLEDNSKTSKPRYLRNVFGICLVTFALVIASSQLQVIYPSMVWNPFAIKKLNVIKPHELPNLMEGLCLDYELDGDNNNQLKYDTPLCLSRKAWGDLSGNALDPTNRDDVETVVKGIAYARDTSGGIIINVMARDTVNAIGPLRQNVEGLLPFFLQDDRSDNNNNANSSNNKYKLAVVIYENDSVDGTRDAFKRWAKEVNGQYQVDLIQCGANNPDCITGESHRYDAFEATDYFQSSAIGRMGEFRQVMVDYVERTPAYDNYSHMLIQDMDLQVSWSPLGLLHTLGSDVAHDSAVACAGRQIWPGTLGSIVPPYDFSAFRALPTRHNQGIMSLHDKFCNLEPPGDRWRNQCDALSVYHLIHVLSLDMNNDGEIGKPYQVESAFNGATLYPLQLIKDTQAKYDAGDDGQRCEHIGFNIGLQKPMYINPKWNFYNSPENPGGPTGKRALNNVLRITFTPKLSLAIGVHLLVCMSSFFYAILVLSVVVLYPILCKIFCCLSKATVRRQRKYSEESPFKGLEHGDDDDYFCCCDPRRGGSFCPVFLQPIYAKLVPASAKHT